MPLDQKPAGKISSSQTSSDQAFAIKLLEQFEDARGARIGHAIVQRLRFAAECDEAVSAQQRQVLRQSGLAQANRIYEVTNFHFAARSQEAENQKPVFVAEKLQHARRRRGLFGKRFDLGTDARAAARRRLALSRYGVHGGSQLIAKDGGQ
jgi:hypothetical protein